MSSTSSEKSLRLDDSLDDSSDERSNYHAPVEYIRQPAPNPSPDPSAYARATLTWKIEHFSTITEPVTSKLFDANGWLVPENETNKILPQNVSFYVRMYPNHQYPHTSAQYTLFYLRAWCAQSISMRYLLSVVNATGSRCLTQDSKIKVLRSESIEDASLTTNGFCSLLREHILDSESGLLKDDALTIFCEIELIDDNYNEEMHHQQVRATKDVLIDYGNLQYSPKYADVILVVGKARAKKQFHAHKAILASRSPVFDALFAQPIPPKKKKNTEVALLIPDIAAEVFQHFIHYIYTGTVTGMNSVKCAVDLLIVADTYQVHCLKSMCSIYLSSSLTVEQVSSILLLADMYNSAELKSNCIDYISDHAEVVMATEDWDQIKDRPELMVHLFQNHVKRFKK